MNSLAEELQDDKGKLEEREESLIDVLEEIKQEAADREKDISKLQNLSRNQKKLISDLEKIKGKSPGNFDGISGSEKREIEDILSK